MGNAKEYTSLFSLAFFVYSTESWVSPKTRLQMMMSLYITWFIYN